MSPYEKKIHLIYMSNLSMFFKPKSGVSHSSLLKNTMFLLDRSFTIFSSARCTEHTISHGRRVVLIPFVTPQPNGPLVTTMETVDWPHRLTQVFPARFGLTRAHLGKLPRMSPQDVTSEAKVRWKDFWKLWNQGVAITELNL